jgi:hypothetical protein
VLFGEYDKCAPSQQDLISLPFGLDEAAPLNAARPQSLDWMKNVNFVAYIQFIYKLDAYKHSILVSSISTIVEISEITINDAHIHQK